MIVRYRTIATMPVPAPIAVTMAAVICNHRTAIGTVPVQRIIINLRNVIKTHVRMTIVNLQDDR